MKYFYLLITILIFFIPSLQTANAQYALKHHIAPCPWQYWSTANEIVISTLAAAPVQVKLYKSDNTLITTLTVNPNTPLSYRFIGNAAALNRNLTDTNYDDRGLIVDATEPVLVNLRNIASDAPGLTTNTIKGNASLVSFGNEGMGLEFRLAYYRTNFTGLFLQNPVYSVMAIEDNTRVELNGVLLTTLNAGQSRLFNAPTGALLAADKSIVANVGSYGDTPMACGGNGEDGTVDQIAPVNALGMQYLVVRGEGRPGTTPDHPEQSTFVATEDGTVVTVKNYTALGVLINQTTHNLNLAGNFASIYHGDATTKLSSSLITADKPIIVYSGTAVGCETDISTVLPIGGCSGSTNIQTTKFINFNGGDLPYFGYTVIESATTPVLINGQNLETVTGAPRVPIGNTGFYILNFTNLNVGNPANIILTSSARMTTCLIQQGDGYSMSGFFSSFGDSPEPPTEVENDEKCSAILKTTEGLEPYQWYLDGVAIEGANEATFEAFFTGNYTVKGTRDCGETNLSSPLFVEIPLCSDLSITKKIDTVEDGVVSFIITVTNNSTIHDDTNVLVNEFLPAGYSLISATPSLGTYDIVSNSWLIPLLVKETTETLTIVARIVPDKGDYLNKVDVKGDNFDPKPENNQAEVKIALDTFIVTKVAAEHSYQDIGDVIEYEIKIQNKGNGILRNVQTIDINADPGSITPAIIAQINPKEEVIVKATHTITEEDYIAGEVINQATVLAETQSGKMEELSDDPSTPAKQDPTVTKIKRSADLTATKTNNQVYYTPGTQTEYTIFVINQGPTSAVNVQISDPLPTDITIMEWSSDKGHIGTGAIDVSIPLMRVSETITFKAKVTIPESRRGDLTNIVEVTSAIDDPNPLCLPCIDNDIERILIPKGISPNGDNLNDFLDLERFHIADLKIFNRQGKLVYSKKDYKRHWHGQSNSGSALPSATYFYTATVDNGDMITGWIHLIK
ncbi:gliding motility-associated C-terminal domain-containing protein [Flavobacterium sp. NKUCC04_CG]|uniref:DUF7507 domain-containing protein n=1 Tax=Flavobacterium sp. NKUCC04_CG TaxID=2842121 RepID=UPI001C5ACA67|nr:gliding motility-associated C-terminal domain-containing protein [Flavobacterium sp. NKUCC04_CG]MBW3520315.1 gliding motility-associated C-terminal domain-containing protein [Flavobacterium sp. NKUCC04_CG]